MARMATRAGGCTYPREARSRRQLASAPPPQGHCPGSGEGCLPKPWVIAGAVGMAVALNHHSAVPQTKGSNRDLLPMGTPAPERIPAQRRLTYPGWVQRKAVTLCKRDQKPLNY